MKNLFPLLFVAIALSCAGACAAQTAAVESSLPAAVQEKTSFDYAREGSAFYLEGDYKRAIPPYQKALDLEKKERKLRREIWILVVDNLGMAYGITGVIKSSQEVFRYGISQEPA